ncbi:putative esterase [Lachnellula occidentalis]|uniref:Putative esterase n=1 Tax=Lachnellula occidentalis TaxID=215460 RepID=A0A8H8S5J6_9HELO|nr:putative esterase [Lachnellula occidentalis]
MAIDSEDSTLYLPRIMALHGGGTNSTIFRMQCRVLERALRPYFRLVYAEAPFPAHPGPDVTLVYSDYGPFKSWLRIRPEDPVQDAGNVVHQIESSLAKAQYEDDRRGATGEWVGLIGFSQGAKLAASILYSQQMQRREKDIRMDNNNHSGTVSSEYRFALLLAGRGPLVWLQQDPENPIPQGLDDAAQATTTTKTTAWHSGESGSEIEESAVEHLLRVPTIHVHGLNDPGLQLHRQLLHRYCDPVSSKLLEWDGVHRVPIKTKDVSMIVDQVLSVAREVGVAV